MSRSGKIFSMST